MSLGRGIFTAVLLACSISPAVAAAGPPQKITFYFGLKRPEQAARSAFFAVQQPGSSTYRRFLSPARVAARFGASPRTRRAFIRAIEHEGLSARIDRSGVFARVTGTVGRFDRVFGVHIAVIFTQLPNRYVYTLPGRERLHLPPGLRGLVQDIVPSYSRSGSFSGARARRRGPQLAREAGARPPQRTGRWIAGCRQAKATGAFSYEQVRRAYGIDRLGRGRAASVAILQVAEGLSTNDANIAARCFGYPRLRARTLITDGQARRFDESDSTPPFEPEEDLALVRGMAPRLSSVTFTQVWVGQELWFLGASQVLDAPRLPDVLSISYGLCERDVRGPGAPGADRAGANLLDSLLVRLGLGGVGSYAAAGDFGSTCNGDPFRGMAWPASSPFLTAVGGTRLTLTATNHRRSEVVWNDLRWRPRTAGGGAGGGGFALVSPRPPYQRNLRIPGETRIAPDVSAAASSFPGWPVVIGGHWLSDGGTSAATPLIATAMAILSSGQRARRLPPIGPSNGLLYALARQARGSIWDVVHGANGYLPKVPARQARRGYDLASGLGVPQFGWLSSRLPLPAR